MNIPPLSQSKQGLLACPHSYVEQVIHGRRGPDSEPSRRGTAVHHFLSEYTRHLLKHKLKRDVAYFEYRLKGLSPDAIEILEGIRDNFAIDPEAVYGTELHISLYDNFKAYTDGPIAVDVAFPFAYEMTLDLVTIDESGRRATIDDYKTNFRAFEADTFQAKLYSLGLMMLNPLIEEVTFRLWFVRWNRDKTAKFTRKNIPELQAEARSWRNVQKALHEQAGSPGVWPGAHCVYCPLLAAGCPIEQNPYSDPAGQLRNVLYFRQALKKAEEFVRAEADKAGPVYARDGLNTEYSAEWTISDERHVSLDALPTLLAWQKAKNDPILSKLRVSGLSTLVKAKKREALAESLANFTEMIPKSKFRIGKKREEEDTDDGDN